MMLKLSYYHVLIIFQSVLFVHSQTNGSEKALGVFEAVRDCANSRYDQVGSQNLTGLSLIQCGVECLKKEDCLSFNFQKSGGISSGVSLATEKRCFLYSTRAESCSELKPDLNLKYMRLTQYKGNGDRLTASPSPDKTDECNYGLNCTETRQCSYWQMAYEMAGDDKVEHAGKRCFIQAVLKGALVRVAAEIAGKYHRLSPISYLYNQSEETEIYFQFAPMHYITTNGQGGFDPEKDYLGVSTKGVGSIYRYDVFGEVLNTEYVSDLRAKFYIRYTNCNESYKTSGVDNANDWNAAPDDTVDFTTAFVYGVVVTSRSEQRSETLAFPVIWKISDPRLYVMGFVRMEKGLFSDVNPLVVSPPIVLRDEIFSTDEKVNTMDSTFLDGISISTEEDTALKVYIDRCWETGLSIDSGGGEDTVFNTQYLKSAILRGSRVRVQYEKDGMHHMKYVYCIFCNVHNCIATIPYHPGLTFDMDKANYKWLSPDNAPNSNFMNFMQIVKTTLIYYNTVTTLVDTASRAMWLVDSISYREVFVASGTVILKDQLQNITKDGVTLLVVAFQNAEQYLSFEVEELVGMDTSLTLEMHSPLIPDVSASQCGTQLYMTYKFILSVNPLSFKKVAWNLAMDEVCFSLRDETFLNITVFAPVGSD